LSRHTVLRRVDTPRGKADASKSPLLAVHS